MSRFLWGAMQTAVHILAILAVLALLSSCWLAKAATELVYGTPTPEAQQTVQEAVNFFYHLFAGNYAAAFYSASAITVGTGGYLRRKVVRRAEKKVVEKAVKAAKDDDELVERVAAKVAAKAPAGEVTP